MEVIRSVCLTLNRENIFPLITVFNIFLLLLLCKSVPLFGKNKSIICSLTDRYSLIQCMRPMSANFRSNEKNTVCLKKKNVVKKVICSSRWKIVLYHGI